MLNPSAAHSEFASEAPFFAALMQHLMQGTMIPKVQVERSIGPIIGFFLEEALKVKLGANLVMLSPEFPILKSRLAEQGNKQSTNIDWLMLNLDAPELLLVELKTTDTTFREEQAQIYEKLQEAIASRGSAAFLLDDLLEIRDASQESGKYGVVLNLLKAACEVDSEVELRERLGQCKRARVIYLAPKVSQPRNWRPTDQGWEWISFGDLPLTLDGHNFPNQWPVLREHLAALDEDTRNKRNGEEMFVAGTKNYREQLKFAPLLERSRREGAAMVVSLQDWRTVLPTMTLQQLEAKTFKYDLADGGEGKKDPNNWISGDQFLAHVLTLQP